MPLKYQSGIDVRKGDRVTYHGEPGEIEFVVEELAGDPGTDWFVHEFGPGVMVLEPKVFGRVYVSPVEDDEHLVFVSSTREADCPARNSMVDFPPAENA